MSFYTRPSRNLPKINYAEQGADRDDPADTSDMSYQPSVLQTRQPTKQNSQSTQGKAFNRSHSLAAPAGQTVTFQLANCKPFWSAVKLILPFNDKGRSWEISNSAWASIQTANLLSTIEDVARRRSMLNAKLLKYTHEVTWDVVHNYYPHIPVETLIGFTNRLERPTHKKIWQNILKIIDEKQPEWLKLKLTPQEYHEQTLLEIKKILHDAHAQVLFKNSVQQEEWRKILPLLPKTHTYTNQNFNGAFSVLKNICESEQPDLEIHQQNIKKYEFLYALIGNQLLWLSLNKLAELRGLEISIIPSKPQRSERSERSAASSGLDLAEIEKPKQSTSPKKRKKIETVEIKTHKPTKAPKNLTQKSIPAGELDLKRLTRAWQLGKSTAISRFLDPVFLTPIDDEGTSKDAGQSLQTFDSNFEPEAPIDFNPPQNMTDFGVNLPELLADLKIPPHID